MTDDNVIPFPTIAAGMSREELEDLAPRTMALIHSSNESGSIDPAEMCALLAVLEARLSTVQQVLEGQTRLNVQMTEQMGKLIDRR